MSLILVSIAVLMVFMLFHVFVGNSILAGAPTSITLETEQSLNGSVSEVALQGGVFDFYIDPTLGAIVLFTTVIAILVIAGITVVGTGLSTSNAIAWTGVYLGLWALISVVGSGFIRSIDVFGWLIYLMITFMYVIGVVQNLSSSGA